MTEKIRLAIIAARNLKTSTGSINTVINLLNNLDENKYLIDIVLIDNLVIKSSQISQTDLVKDPSYKSFENVEENSKVSKIVYLDELTLGNIRKNYDVAIVAIYNDYGEDGRIIGLLETVGLPYVSPNLKTSALCLDKSLTKSVLRDKDILVPDGIEVFKELYSYEDVHKQIIENFGYPVIVKTLSSGASRGISLVKDFTQLSLAIYNAFLFSKEALIEPFISGDEYTVAVTGHFLSPKALPVVLIKTENSFFDYDAKYTANKAEEICPAPISPELTKLLQDTALKAYQAVKANSHSRIDLIVQNNKIYVLEINTFPGLTMSSLFPKELEAMGSSLKSFLDQSLNDLVEKKRKVDL